MNVDDDDADGPLDPRIEMELENLNNATDEINQLEIELDEARRSFAQLQLELKNKFIEEQNRAGATNIMKAKAYYEAVAARNEAQLKCRREAESFRKASENLAAAMETESVAMNSFKLHQHQFNESWQEWLNQVTAQVMEDSNKKMACQREHQKITAHYNEAERRVKELGEKYRKALIKTKPFFEIKERFEHELPLQKEKIRCLEKSIQKAKCIYATSLRALEEISNQIHQQRRDYDIIANGPREPGVGAELVTPEESLQFNDEPSSIIRSRKNSMGSNSDADKEEAEQDLKDVLELRRSIDNVGTRSADGSESTSSQWELELQAGLEKLNNTNPALSLLRRISQPGLVHAHQPEQLRAPPAETLRNQAAPSQTPKKSFFGNISTAQSPGWQSLTQSPINSIFSKSKVALKNSLSKSLASSPVNKGSFTFGKAKAGIERDADGAATNAESSKSVGCPAKKPAAAMELPLLSIFRDSGAIKDRSLSMVNLDDKQGLKGSICKSAMNNIQAVSVEKLASTRFKLIGDGS